MGQDVRSQRQSATRLACKACFKGSVESNMEPTLGQRCRNENAISRHDEIPFNVFLMSPKKVSSMVFHF
jgi:hypothetical protein